MSNDVDLPVGFDVLYRDAVLNQTLDLHWYDKLEREDVHANWLAVWNQVPYDDEFHELCRVRLLRCIPLARAKVRQRRLSHSESHIHLISDPAEPERVFVTLSYVLPSILWISSQISTQALLEKLQAYLVEETPSLHSLPCVYRIGKIGITSIESVEHTIENLEYWMDDVTWGNQFDDDPWLNYTGKLSMLDQARIMRMVRQEDDRRYPSLSWRTLWSRSVLTVEKHPYGLWVFALRYAPANNVEVFDEVDKLMGRRLPRDLPVDLVGSLLRGSIFDYEHIKDLAQKEDALFDRVVLTCAIDPAEMTSFEFLRQMIYENSDNDQALSTLSNVALSYYHDSLLFDIMELTNDPNLVEQIKTELRPYSKQDDIDESELSYDDDYFDENDYFDGEES